MIIKFGWLLSVVTLSLLVIYSDIKHRKVSNRLCLLIAFLCAGYAFIYTEVQVLIPITILVIGIALSYLRILGGGDTKLLAAYFIAISPDAFLATLVVIGISGGVLSLIYLLKNKIKKNTNNSLPYAIPITIGGLIGILASM
ncbi:prepilin peptidase [Vibrio brasiliensis]|uniref:prepilin peptidase n=1 Tax=Vibrio brasiliensis TaxID=170652 RepID=UPI0023D866AE|nr:prepilin peptidase [Vibrio brasiliensis]MCG9724202.1 prepilin peptidase [Vibrio brasiliensis]